MMTLSEAVAANITKIRLENWAHSPDWKYAEYLELTILDGKTGICGTLHSILETTDVPEHSRIASQQIPLFLVPEDGWVELEEGANGSPEQ